MTFTGKDSPMQQLMLSLLGAVAEFSVISTRRGAEVREVSLAA
jgi:hypothetical protein